MDNYFLKSDSVIENILKENSIDFNILNIEGKNGIILDKSCLDSLKSILIETFEDVDVRFLGSTSYSGIYNVSITYYSDEDEDEEFETDEELLEEIRNIDAEITRLRNRKELIERKIKNIAIESIQEYKEYSGIIL